MTTGRLFATGFRKWRWQFPFCRLSGLLELFQRVGTSFGRCRKACDRNLYNAEALHGRGCPPGVPEWVVTYGDMMSLLLTFFIMLVLLSEVVAEKKYRAILEAIQEYGAYAGGAAGQKFSRQQPDGKAGIAGVLHECGSPPWATRSRANRRPIKRPIIPTASRSSFWTRSPRNLSAPKTAWIEKKTTHDTNKKPEDAS